MSVIAMSYEALAERLGINVASVRRLALGKRWWKGKGNDGNATAAAQDSLVETARRLGMAEGEVAAFKAQADEAGEARQRAEKIGQDRDHCHAAATRSWLPWRRRTG
jgi:hypothetical protein